jgi:hypothetical protein
MAVLNAALRARNRDPSLRLMFPLAECDLEAAAGSPHHILSLRTPDGFEVCFSISQEVLARIGELVDLGWNGTDAVRALH